MPFGVQIPDHIRVDEALPALVALGAQWGRLNVYWRQVEPERTTPPSYRWAALDRTLQKLQPAGLHLILTIRDNPAWAAEIVCGPLNGEGREGMSDFLASLVSRYSQPPYNVKYWELYNEPDNGDPERYSHYGGCWGHDSDAYAAMLKDAYQTIKAADGEAEVLIGGVAYEDFDTDIFVVDFLDKVLDAGGGAHFDILNFHYYPAFDDVWNRYGNDVAGKANYLRAEMERYGLNKRLAITEVGQPTEGPAEDEQPYSDERTARYVVQAMVRGASVHLETLIWFSLIDNPQDPRKYGLLREDGTPKPAYQAYRTLTRQLGQSSFVRMLPSGDLGADGLEAYEFAIDTGERWVLWSTDGQPHPLSISGSVVSVTDLYGEARRVTDGEDGDTDGRIILSIGLDPIYFDLDMEGGP